MTPAVSSNAMTDHNAELMEQLDIHRRELERFVVSQLLPKVHSGKVRKTQHFREWWRTPMNYVRLMELPLTLTLLDVMPMSRILDIGSPKLLALYLSAQRQMDIIVSDIEDYFVSDFTTFGTVFGNCCRLGLFDARHLPLQDASFDRIFSVSALEHIPDQGDVAALQEIRRILKPEGLAVVTVPAATKFFEEWLRHPHFYWHKSSTRNQYGETFYQRRYDVQSFESRITSAGLVVDTIVFIAEQPIQVPYLSHDGRYLHNFHFLPQLWAYKIAGFLGSRCRTPLLPYLVVRHFSGRLHYLTNDADDPNIRQIAVRVRRSRQ